MKEIEEQVRVNEGFLLDKGLQYLEEALEELLTRHWSTLSPHYGVTKDTPAFEIAVLIGEVIWHMLITTTEEGKPKGGDYYVTCDSAVNFISTSVSCGRDIRLPDTFPYSKEEMAQSWISMTDDEHRAAAEKVAAWCAYDPDLN